MFMDKLNVKAQEESVNWTQHQDALEFNNFLIKSNYSNWESTKKHYEKELDESYGQPFSGCFYLQIESFYSDGSIYVEALNVAEAKKLRDYLIEKIDYLEGYNK